MSALSKPSLGLHTLRRLHWLAQRTLSIFFNLEAVEMGLLTSRMIEYPFIVQKLDGLPRGKVADVGCTDPNNFPASTLATLGWQVYGIDLREYPYEHPNFRLVREDIRWTSFPDAFFDCAYAVSTLEHIGFASRYGITANAPQGDIEAAREIWRIVRPGGLFLLTVPYGRVRGAIKPTERIYDNSRLGEILRDWVVRSRVYYQQDNAGKWKQVPEEVASTSLSLALVESVRPGDLSA